MSDHVDVINMSLGSSFGPNDVNDPELIAVEAASQAGVFVVASREMLVIVLTLLDLLRK